MIDIVLVRIILFMEITDNKIGFLRYELAKVVVAILVKRHKEIRQEEVVQWFFKYISLGQEFEKSRIKSTLYLNFLSHKIKLQRGLRRILYSNRFRRALLKKNCKQTKYEVKKYAKS